MIASADDQPTRQHWRLAPIPALRGVLAVIGAVVSAVSLAGCRGSSGGQGPTASSHSAAPSAVPSYRVTGTVPLGKSGGWLAADPGTHTVYVTKRDNNVAVIQSR